MVLDVAHAKLALLPLHLGADGAHGFVENGVEDVEPPSVGHSHMHACHLWVGPKARGRAMYRIPDHGEVESKSRGW